jgi:hypothetical protein
MHGRRFPLSFWRCWVPALLLAKCSPAPNHPAASPETSPSPRPTQCAHADAEASAREQQRDAEIALLRSELQEHPNDAEGWAKLGKASGNADAASAASAIDAFDHATRLAPNLAVHWKHLGEAHWSNAAVDPKAAELSKAAFLNCLQREPQLGDCHCSLGIVQHFQGNHTVALQSFKRAVENGAACEYLMAGELFELGELEQSNLLVRKQLARIPAHPGNVDQLYSLQKLELRIAVQRESQSQVQAARQRLAEYALGVSPEFAFNLGSIYAVVQPPQPTEAKQLLGRFVQTTCASPQSANACDQCVVARDLLAHLAATSQ